MNTLQLVTRLNSSLNEKDKTKLYMLKFDYNRLNTKNLLRYYRAERRRFYGSGYWCGCGCGEIRSDMERKYNEHKDFLGLVKNELNTREHIK